MQIKERQQGICFPRPQSYAALMEMYEVNYIRLRLLCGDLKLMQGKYYSSVEGHVPVTLEIREQTAHTSIICLTYAFDEEGKDTRPDLEVRVYHDARQAEVSSRKCRMGTNARSWEADIDNMLLCRWRLNRFLYKWSAYLRRQGHSFTDTV